MIISGLQQTTLLDYPGHVAATVFLGGCNMRCPFCHNAEMVLNPACLYAQKDVLDLLKKRKGILEGVCVTGGEPTIHKDLPEFIYSIKNLGYLVKLDTNGTNPQVIRALYEGHLIDYVAMDIKGAPDNYKNCCGTNADMNSILESISYIMGSGLEYEFRTTLVKGLHTKEDMIAIGSLIKGAKAYYLQSYKDNETVMDRVLTGDTCCQSFSTEELEKMREIVARYCMCSIRGV